MAEQAKNPNYQTNSKGFTRNNEFSILSGFPLGYRNREDVTNLPPGVLIPGSQNVLTDVTGRVGITQGYVLDGQTEAQTVGFLLQEDDFYILQEDNYLIEL